MECRKATICLTDIRSLLGIHLVHRERARHLPGLLFKVSVVQAHELRAQKRFGVFYRELAIGAILNRHTQRAYGRICGLDVLYLCNLIWVLVGVEGQTQSVDMRAPEISIGYAVVELQGRSGGGLFSNQLVISECWHEAKGSEERSESDNSLFVNIRERVVEL
jgi:hypothetical protein